MTALEARENHWRAAERNGPSAFLTWRTEWTLGIASMDADHRDMVDQLNRIAEHLNAARASQHTIASGHFHHSLVLELQSLSEHTRVHFAREEALMQAASYPLANEHKREHTMLLAEMTEFVREFCRMPLQELEPHLLASFKHWFLGHLLDMDRNLARHLHRIGMAYLGERH